MKECKQIPRMDFRKISTNYVSGFRCYGRKPSYFYSYTYRLFVDDKMMNNSFEIVSRCNYYTFRNLLELGEDESGTVYDYLDSHSFTYAKYQVIQNYFKLLELHELKNYYY